MQAREIGQFMENLVPDRPTGPDEGFRWGSPNAEITGVMVAFFPTVEAIEACADEGCNLLIVHEMLQMPYPWRGDGDLGQHLTWPVNRNRISALAKHDITLFRAHGTLDRFCIHQAFVNTLGLGAPAVEDGFTSIFEMAPIAVRDLVEEVKTRTGMPAVRVTADLDREVSRVGLPWGGTGLSVNAGFINSVIEHGPDVLIAGESDEYAMRMVRDCGVELIETGHAVSEEPGLQWFAGWLGEQFSGLRVLFHQCEPAWQVL
ncbi:MAG: Nif3-like dinuclear metal center hexameric protein [Armatimonadota bacterium]